jgi:hypothetical protein
MFEDDTQEDEVIEVEETEETEDVEETEDEERDWKAEAEREKARADKAEATIVKAKAKPKVATQTDGLTTSDILALAKADIADEDIDEVLEWAKFKKISISDALKSSSIKATLTEKAEERKSAQAVHTTGGRRAGGTVSDERLLSDASKGIMPDSEEDIARIARLRFLKK